MTALHCDIWFVPNQFMLLTDSDLVIQTGYQRLPTNTHSSWGKCNSNRALQNEVIPSNLFSKGWDWELELVRKYYTGTRKPLSTGAVQKRCSETNEGRTRGGGRESLCSTKSFLYTTVLLKGPRNLLAGKKKSLEGNAKHRISGDSSEYLT